MKSINVLRHELETDLLNLTEENIDMVGKKYLEYIELLFYMFLRDGDFYAYILIQLNRKINFFVSNAAGVMIRNQKVTLFINPLLFHKYNYKEQKAVLEHECLHVLNNHVPRLEPLMKKGHSKMDINVAADLAINQFIGGLPSTSITLESIGEQLSVRFPRNLTVENYLHIIEKKKQEMKEKMEEEEEERRKQQKDEGSDEEGDDESDEFEPSPYEIRPDNDSYDPPQNDEHDNPSDSNDDYDEDINDLDDLSEMFDDLSSPSLGPSFRYSRMMISMMKKSLN